MRHFLPGSKTLPVPSLAMRAPADARPASSDSEYPLRVASGVAPRYGTDPSSNDGPGRSASRCNCSARRSRTKIAGNPASALAP